MALSFRQTEILHIAEAEGRVTVEGLAERFGVTLQTIRRDLGELAMLGRLERVHGGGVPASGVSNIAYNARRLINAEAKAGIAAACAARIPNDASLFLNIGTSTEAVAGALRGHRNILVVTNNINVANILIDSEGCEIVVAGGTLRRSDGGLVGDATVDTVCQFKLDFAITGVSAVDAEGDLLDYDHREVRVTQAILRQARHRILVADSTKLSRTAPARVGSLREIDTLITDAPLPPPLADRLAAWNTAVVLAEPRPAPRARRA